jgi:hypothetical protein
MVAAAYRPINRVAADSAFEARQCHFGAPNRTVFLLNPVILKTPSIPRTPDPSRWPFLYGKAATGR